MDFGAAKAADKPHANLPGRRTWSRIRLAWGPLLILAVGVGCATLDMEFPDAPEGHSGAVVFDIDGTLTPTVARYRTPRTDAATAVWHYADHGFKIVYLTARIRALQRNIPAWLKDQGFPEGNLYVTASTEDAWDHAAFKTRVLEELQARGWTIEFAYGDSTTDFEAYERAGIPAERVFALQREGAANCQPGPWSACLSGWTEHLEVLASGLD